MPKPTNKQELLAEIRKERTKFETLLESVPSKLRNKEVVEGMSVKDFLAHRAEWGAMMIRWYEEAKSGKTPAVPHKDFKWNQLPALNAKIQKKYARWSLQKVETYFTETHDALFELVSGMSQEELYEKGVFSFTKSTNLAAYINSSTAAHYRSAAKHIRKWAKSL